MRTPKDTLTPEEFRQQVEAARQAEIANFTRRETLRQSFLTHLRGEVRSWFAPISVKQAMKLSSRLPESKEPGEP